MARHDPTGRIVHIALIMLALAAVSASAQAAHDPTTRLLPCCRVIAVDAAASQLSVKDERTGKVFQMLIRGAGGKGIATGRSTRKAMSSTQYQPGQTVFINESGTLAAVTSFPVTRSRKDNIERTSWTMETAVTLSNTGRIDGTTKIKTAEALRGFTGGVLVGVTDLDGNILHTTKLHTYGVDGTAKPGGKSSRTEHWSEVVPKDSLGKAAAVVIWHSHQPKNRFPGAMQWVKENWLCIVELYKYLKPDSTQRTGDSTSGTPPGGAWGPPTPGQMPGILDACKNFFN